MEIVRFIKVMEVIWLIILVTSCSPGTINTIIHYDDADTHEITDGDIDRPVNTHDGGKRLPPIDIEFNSKMSHTEFRIVKDDFLYRDSCPEGEVLIGMQGSFSSIGWIGQMGGICGSPSMSCSTTPCDVKITVTEELDLRGSSGEKLWKSTCPDDHMITGFGGMAGDHIDLLVLRCSLLVVVYDGENYNIEFGNSTDLNPIGAIGGDYFPQTDCPPGQGATQSNMYVGTYVHSFSLGCQAPSLLY